LLALHWDLAGVETAARDSFGIANAVNLATLPAALDNLAINFIL